MDAKTINLIRSRGAKLRAQDPEKFTLLIAPYRQREFVALFPHTTEWLREKGLLHRTLGQDVMYYFLNSHLPLPKCRICGGSVTFHSRRCKPRAYCSNACAHKDPSLIEARANTRRNYSSEQKAETRKKTTQTLLKNYGVTSPLKSAVIKAKVRTTNRERYGADVPTQNASVKAKISKTRRSRCAADLAREREKSERTCLRRYGVKNPMMLDSVKARICDTNILRYGTPYHSSLPEVRKKLSLTLRTRTLEEKARTRAQTEATCLARYGVRHAAQSKRHADHYAASQHRRKMVRINGTSHSVQGYEPYVLRVLESKIERLATRPSSMPKINYTHPKTRRESRYYPDAKLITTAGARVLLEVKSPYTLKAALETNLAKMKAAIAWCKSNHAVFVLAITDGKTYVHWFYNPTAAQIKRFTR